MSYIYSNYFGKDMLFYTFDEFKDKRQYLKEQLLDKDEEYIAMYGLYIESRPWIKEYFRGVMWDYLMDYMSEIDFIIEYNKYDRRRVKVGDSNA